MARKAKILLVEDDQDIADFVKEILRPSYSVSHDRTGQKTIESVPDLDLVILDISLPNLSGLDIGRHLKTVGVPFVFMTAADDKKTIEIATEIGALSYITKPITNPAQLTATVSIALEVAGTMLIERARGILEERRGLSLEQADLYISNHAETLRISISEAARRVVEDAEALTDIKKNQPPVENFCIHNAGSGFSGGGFMPSG